MLKTIEVDMSNIRPGFSWGSLICLIGLVAIVGYLAYSATNKTDSESYTKGATHNESTMNVSPVQNNYPLSIPGCGRFLTVQTPDGVKFTDLDRKQEKKNGR